MSPSRLFIYDCIGLDGNHNIVEYIRLESIVAQLSPGLIYMIMSKETKPVLAWYMCNYELFGSDDKMLSYFEDDGLGEAQKFNRHKWYSRRI